MPPSPTRAAALASVAALTLSALPAQAAGTLELQVDNVGSADGSLMIALYDKAGDWRDRPVRSLQQVARPGSVTVTFADLPPGSYAIALYHDRNGNGKLDSNVMGIPREPYGRDASQVHDIRVDLAGGRASAERLSEIYAEFPRFDPRHAGRRTGALFVASRSPTMQRGLFGFNGVARMNLETGAVQRFSYGDSVIAEEHLFVPRAGGREGEGWLVGSALDWRARRTLVSVLDASRLPDGPIVQASLPYLLPPGLHGAWVPAA